MISPRTTLVAVGAAIGLFAVIGAGVAPQRPTQPSDPVAQEIRDLRVAIERAAAVSVQVSLVAQRASAAQAMVSSISLELAHVRSELARASAEMARYNAIVSDPERVPAGGKDPLTGPQYPGFVSNAQARAQLGSQRQLEQALRLRESELAAALNREQAEWNQLAAKLEALERTLGGQR